MARVIIRVTSRKVPLNNNTLHVGEWGNSGSVTVETESGETITVLAGSFEIAEAAEVFDDFKHDIDEMRGEIRDLESAMDRLTYRLDVLEQ
jgi:hypothetical protein